MRIKYVRILRIAVAIVLCGLFPSAVLAQFGPRPMPPGPSPGPPPILPAPVARQSALPLIAPPVSPILNRPLPAWGWYGGFSYYPQYGYSQPVIVNNYNYLIPEPWFPPRNFAVPAPVPHSHPHAARLTLSVPAGATVFIGGKKMEVTSNQQTYESPELKTGESFTFDVRVTWKENGKQIEEKRTLTMRAGEHQSLQYIALPATAIRLEK